jgi:hypothetical protein
MGQVYRATDTTLSRQVAIKILPDAFAADPERMARFEREAKTKDLPAGQDAVSATKVNYIWVARGSDRTRGIGAPITVVDGQVIDGLDLKLQPAGVVTGRILDEFKGSVAGAQVRAGAPSKRARPAPPDPRTLNDD